MKFQVSSCSSLQIVPVPLLARANRTISSWGTTYKLEYVEKKAAELKAPLFTLPIELL